MAQGKLIGLRLFLEGIEVDVVSATVSAGVGQPCSANIEIPPADSAQDIKPRTLVHLFYSETAYVATEPTTERPFIQRIETYTDSRNWKLLFTGEVLAVGISKTGGIRSNVLQCQDFSSYWQACQLYWGTGSNVMNAYKKISFLGGTQLVTGKSKVVGGNALANLLGSKPTSNPTLPGVLGGVVSLLEAATGVYDSPGAKKFRGVNDFMSQAELRLHLTRMIGASPDDDTSAAFLDYGDMKTYFRQYTASVQSTASFFDLMQQLLGKVYYSWASVAAPPYIPAGAVAKLKQVVPSNIKFSKSKELVDVYSQTEKTLRAVSKRLETARDRRNFGNKEALEGKDPAKVTADGSAPDVRAHDEFAKEVAGIGLVDGIRSTDSKESSEQAKAAGTPKQKRIEELSASIGGNKQLGKIAKNVQISTGLGYVREAIGVINNINERGQIVYTDQYKQHTEANLRLAQSKLEEGLKNLAKGVGAPVKTVVTKTTLQSRLNMFLFMPDLYMAPPPKCNVLFPDHYVSLSYSRSWMQEVTRMWLFGRTLAGQETLTGYFSPNTSILSGPKAKTAAEAASKGTSFLMPHERFTGPIPAIQSLGDNGVFKRIHSNVNKQYKDLGVLDTAGSAISGQAKFSPQEHMQRAANYMYFSQRFSGRSASVEARFSPQLVPGLSMLVLDPLDGQVSSITRKGDGASVETPAGTHIVGLLQSVTHTISAQGGANTHVVMTKCRHHREGLEVFGTVDDDGFVEYSKRITRTITSNKKIAAWTDHSFGARSNSKDRLRDPEYLPAKGILANEGIPVVRNSAGKIVPLYGLPERKVVVNGKTKVLPAVAGMTESLPEIYSKEGYVRRKTVIDAGGPRFTIKVEDRPLTEKESAAYAKSVATRYAPVDGRVSSLLTNTASFFDPNDPTSALLKTRQDGSFAPIEANDPLMREIFLEKTTTNTARKRLSFTFEATTTPPWFSSIYLPTAIGTQYYAPMLGCRSVLDDTLVQAPAAQGGSKVASVTVSVGDVGSEEYKELLVPSEFTDDAYSTQDAADKLADLWLGLRQANANVTLFSESYTSRYVATMHDIFGGIGYNTYLSPKVPIDEPENIVMEEGFHSHAFGMYSGMERSGPLDDKANGYLLEEPMYAKFTAKKQPVTRVLAAGVDTRGEKYVAAARYRAEVQKHATSTRQDAIISTK